MVAGVAEALAVAAVPQVFPQAEVAEAQESGSC